MPKNSSEKEGRSSFRELRKGDEFWYNGLQYKKVNESMAADVRYSDDSVVYPIHSETFVDTEAPEETEEEEVPSESQIRRMTKTQLTKLANDYGVDVEGQSVTQMKKTLAEALHEEEEGEEVEEVEE